jgi:nitrogen-specific signal transduction histidine kinase/ActR/RegA family two-component response regulator
LRIVRTPVKDERGAVGGVLGMRWDVTQQRFLEAQLRQAQKMDAIGMLAGGIAHDFNNLLTVIVGNIALALGSLPESHPSRDLMLTAERAGVQANELTNRLLGFARQTILRPVATQLGTCMEETARILRRTVDPRIVLEVRPAPRLWLVEADPAQINQVLLNLCLNARDAMPQGGRILLEADNVVVDEEYARQRLEARPGEFVRLSVADTGHGIAAEIRPRIFEPFFTTKGAGKGTGLGLAMVFGIIKQHHGWVDFTSEVNGGTHFDIFLPRHGAGIAPATAPPTALEAPRGGPETILLADDEPMIRQLGRTILERYGYRVLLADDGLEAVQSYEQHKDEIALVILDLMMPRLSGHDALQHLLQMDPDVRVLLASGYSAEHLDQGYHEQVMGFISKPFHPDQLVRMVREALDKPRQLNP